MARIALIDGHPDPDRARFVHALAEAYAEGADGTHELRLVNVADLDFPLLRSAADWQEDALPASLAGAQEAIGWAEHVVILYPFWLGDVPALLKGFLEQIMRPGFALRYTKKGFPKMQLKGRSARVIVTMGMPAPLYCLYFRAHSLKSLRRNVLGLVGFRPVRTSVIGMVEGSAAHRQKWLDKMRAMGRKAA